MAFDISAFGGTSSAPLPKSVGVTLPPEGGSFVIPHYQTFATITNLIAKTYRWTFDEALLHNEKNALAIRRDPVVMDALQARQIPTCQLAWHLEAQDDTAPAQVSAVKELTKDIEAISNFQLIKLQLLEALFYGRSAVQLTFGWDFSTGKKRLRVTDYEPINGDKLVFKFDGTPGVRVHYAYEGSWEPTDRGRVHFYTDQEQETIIIHKHIPEDADFFEGEMAGSVHGVGIRSKIYWFWWLRSQVQSWLMDYLERVGAGGFTVYYYESGNPDSLQEVKTAAEDQFRNNAILFPRYRDGTTGGPGLERIEPSVAGAQLLEELCVNYFDTVIRRYILGQTLSQDANPSGFGNSAANFVEDQFGSRIKFDALNLQETITKTLVAVLCRWNHPGIPCPRFVFDVDKPNAGEVLAAAQAFFEMGGQIDEDELRSIIGLSKPTPGHSVLAKFPAQGSPVGVGAVPTGIPQQGQPGPDMAQGAQPSPQEGESPILFAARYPWRLEAHPGIGLHVQGYQGKEEPNLPYLPHDPEYASKIADYYEGAPHVPQDPQVRRAYDAFKKETLAQWKYLKAKGVKMEPWQQEGQPYQNSKEMREDARKGHLYFFTGGDLGEGNLLSEPTGEVIGGQPLNYNDVFRAVHDYFGHAHYGNEFGPRGEEHAWRVHKRMYTPEAQKAMSFETRGQNSWVNFGPQAQGKTPQERPFAVQKNNLLPQHLMEDTHAKQQSPPGGSISNPRTEA